MEKYLRARERQNKSRIQDNEEKSFLELKILLEKGAQLPEKLLEDSLVKNKMAIIREILYYCRYPQYMKIIEKYVKKQQINENPILKALLDKNLGIVKSAKQQNTHKSNKAEEKSYRAKILVAAGIVIFILFFQRRRITDILAKMIRKK